ncbi:MAG TPA: hypothetical protein VGH69_02830 [Mycobacterium sp.]
MTGGSAEAVSLLWLRELAVGDQIALLRYPRRKLSVEVAAHVADVLGRSAVVVQLWGPSDRWRLAEPVASQLSRVREKLDKWWNSNSLTITDRNYLIEHRADAELPAHTVRVEPPVIRAYLEMKVPEAPPR